MLRRKVFGQSTPFIAKRPGKILARDLQQKWHGQKNKCLQDVAGSSWTSRGEQPAANAAHSRALSGAASLAYIQIPVAGVAATNRRSNRGTIAGATCGENHPH